MTDLRTKVPGYDYQTMPKPLASLLRISSMVLKINYNFSSKLLIMHLDHRSLFPMPVMTSVRVILTYDKYSRQFF